MITPGENYLITTDGWFYGPDGQHYRSVWGKAEMITTKEAFDFNPTRSTNWFVRVGGEANKAIVIAGCQIHYAIRCDEKPHVKNEVYTDKETGLDHSANCIYIVE